MLKSLHIENIAVIEETDIEFSSGFNVLTGETGAGKSIIIDAISAVLGERTSKDLIRNGSESGTVTALFCDISDYSKSALKENGYSTDEDGNLLIMRKLTASGSQIKINGRPATAGILKEIGKSLINIHGQHDNQTLLNPETHYVYIDRLADNKPLLDDYYKEYHRINNLRKELASYETDEAQKKRDIELLKYQIKELSDADLKPGEGETLRKQLKTAQNSKQIADALKRAYGLLNGNETDDGAFSAIRDAQKELSIFDDEFKDVDEKFLNILSSLDDVSCDLRRRITEGDGFAFDTEAIEDRLDTIYRMSMKYGGSEESAINFLSEAKEKLNKIELSDERIKELSSELDISTERLIKKGEALTNSRKKAAVKFSKDVTKVLLFLDMPNVVFEVKIEQGRYTKIGCDNIEFMICANAGETLKPLSKIASGGELSRVMLAIKSVLSNKDDVDTLIFDEIDTGISGKAAQKVGHQLKEVSACRQTVCVTHLAQIAAFAKNHLLVRKSVKDNRTFTEVTSLKGEARIREIATIMAGSKVSENVYKSAKELLERNF